MPDADLTEGDERSASSRVDLHLSIECEGWGGTAAMERLAGRAVRAALTRSDLRTGPTEVSLVLTDDESVRGLNAQWRGKDTPTNVLSFPAFDLSPGDAIPPILGDIVVARQTVAREAAEEGKSFPHHLTHLIVHGTLHLCGWDHSDDEEAEAMEAREIAILAGLGIANPYLQTDEPA